MSALEKLIRREEIQQEIEEGIEREIAQGVFREWRDRYVGSLCAYMRLLWEAEDIRCKLPEPFHTREWCNAAVQILTVADVSIQDRFLRANQKERNQMVDAVLKDGGVADFDGRFVELPVL